MRKKRFMAFLLSLAMAGTSVYTCGVIDVQAAAFENQDENPNMDELTDLPIIDQPDEARASGMLDEPDNQQLDAPIVDQTEDEPQAQATGDGDLIVSSNDVKVAHNGKVEWGNTVTISGADAATNACFKFSDKTVAGASYELTEADCGKTITASANAKNMTFTVDKRSLSSDMISVSPNTGEYTGERHNPNRIISDNHRQLVIGTDVEVETVGDLVNPSEAGISLNVKGLPNSAYKTDVVTSSNAYTITKQAITDVKFSEILPQRYTGRPINPAVTVTSPKGTPMVEGTDYSINWSAATNTTDHPQAIITIPSGSRFTGSVPNKTNVFEITPFEGATFKVEFKGKAQSFGYGVSVGDIKQNLVVSADTVVGMPAVAVSDGDFDFAIEQLNQPKDTDVLEVGKYTVKLTGKRNFVQSTGTVAFEVTRQAVADSAISVNFVSENKANVSQCSVSFNNEAKKPEVVVSVNGETLKKDTDYTVTYENNTNAGTAYAVITLTSDTLASKTVKVPFTITPISMSEKVVSYNVAKAPVYNGGAQKPADADVKIEAKFGARNVYTLEQGVDYTVSEASYKGNIDAGDRTYTVSACAKGNFTGKLDINYKIAKKSISDNDVEWKSSVKPSYVYTGQQIKPNVVMTYQGHVSSNKNLTRADNGSADFKVEYATNTSQTTGGKVTVTGTGNYIGVQDTTFEITDKRFTDVHTKDIPYQGKPISVADLADYVSVSADDYAIATSNYKITYDNGVNPENVGEYAITVKGIDNYSGEVNVLHSKVKIVAAELVSGNGGNVKWETGHVYKSQNPNEYEPPVVTVSVGDKVFVKGTDYDVECQLNPGATRGTITITAKPDKNIKGTIRGYFDVTKTNFAKTDLQVVDYKKPFEYNGSAQTPSANDIVLKDMRHDVVLSAADFTLMDPQNNVNAGTAYIDAYSRHPNYMGSCTISYNIAPKDINDDKKVVLSANTKTTVSAPYTGDENVLSADNLSTNCLSFNGVYLTTEDYDLVFKKGDKVVTKYTDVDEYTVFAVGKKNFTGERKLGDIKITPKTLEESPFYLEPNEVVYTGEEFKPEVKVRRTYFTRDYEIIPSVKPLINKGAYEIGISGNGNYTGSFTLPFTIKGVEINNDNTEVSFSGLSENGYLFIDVKTNGKRLVRDEDYTYTYTSANNTTPQKWNVVITATAKGNYEGSIRDEVEFGKITLEDDDVIVSADFVFNNEEQQLTKDQIKVVKGNKTLSEGSDYTVSNPVAAKKAGAFTTLSINGMGDYQGTATAKAEIKRIPLDPNGVKVTDDVVWTGSAAAPKVEVSVNGVVLAKDIDYTVTIDEKDTDIGNGYKVKVEGIGNYSGEVTKTYNIVAPSLDYATIVEEKLPYTGEVQKPTSIRVMLGDQVVPADQYDIVYENENSTEVGTYNITATGKEGAQYTGTAKGTYQIVALTLNDAKVDVKPFVYTGSKADPEVTVTIGDVTLEKDVDYIVDAGNAINAKDGYNLTIAGIGSYSGEIKTTFDIKPATITTSNVKVTIPAVTYNGKAQTPKNPIIIVGARELKAADYTLAVAKGANNTNAGKVKVTITGKGNYTGTVTGEWFTINRRSISRGKVSGIKDKTYTGKAIAQGVIVTLDGKKLTKSNGCLNITYKNNKNIGPASLTITGRGNYTGTLSGRTFRIFPGKATIKSLKAGKNRFTIQTKKLNGGVKYQIQYRVKGSKSGYTRVETKDLKKVIKGLRKGKTYTVKVRAYKKVSGKIYYGAFSKAKNVKVK